MMGFLPPDFPCCRSSVTPEGRLTDREESSMGSPVLPPLCPRTNWLGWRVPAPRPPFTGLNGLALFIFTLCHTEGTPISQCHSGFVQQLCIYVCERDCVCVGGHLCCLIADHLVCIPKMCVCVFLWHIYVCLCVLSLPLCSVVTQSSAFIFLS